MISALQPRAEALGHSLPALLAGAEALASVVALGEHGRKRSGQGDEFWQYRAAQPGDPLRMIDWRRSGRSDQHFLREHEWQSAQSVTIWADLSQSMGFSGAADRAPKSDRAALLALALAVLLLRGGERVGLAGDGAPKSGRAQILALAQGLIKDGSGLDYGRPEVGGMVSHGRAVFLSDFFGPIEAVETALIWAADRGVKGALVQILDPVEEDFSFDGRTIFESMGGDLRHETRKASDLRRQYQDRLAARKDRLGSFARSLGWQFSVHHTDNAAQSALLWLYRALEGTR